MKDPVAAVVEYSKKLTGMGEKYWIHACIIAGLLFIFVCFKVVTS